MTFNVLFPDFISAGSKFIPTFSNVVMNSNKKKRTVQVNRDQPIRRYDVSHVLNNPEKLAMFLDFFYGVRGNAAVFLFRDWSDYLAGGKITDGGIVTTTPESFAIGDGVKTQFQLTKTYAKSFNPMVRNIYHVGTTTKIYFYTSSGGYVLQSSGFSVGQNTGFVTFTSPPPSGTTICWVGEFFVEVAFEEQEMEISLDNPNVGNWNSIVLQEVTDAA